MRRLDYHREIQRYRFPRELEADLVALFERCNERPAKKRWTDTRISFRTAYRRFVNVCAAFKDLASAGYALRRLANFRAKHVHALVRLWDTRGEAAGTIANKLSYLRTLAAWIGKPGMLAKIGVPTARRRGAACRDKTWSGNAVDVLQTIEQVRLRDSVVALQIELQLAFGMRVEEAFLFRPGKGLLEAVDRLYVHLDVGTKGGRPRDVQLDELVQLDVLLRAASKATGPGETLIPKSYTLQQWRDHYYYIVRLCGIRRDTADGGLGVTCHGLRHEYLNRLFERITGKPAPVRGGTAHDPALYDLAMRMVVERAGHSDQYKSGAYLGTRVRTSRATRARQSEMLPAI